MFGSGVVLQVTMTWDAEHGESVFERPVDQCKGHTAIPATNWTAGSVFDLGAEEYQTYGGYYVSDDVIDGFTVVGPAIGPDTTPPVVSLTAPANGATVSGTVTVTANATDNVAVTGVQFQLDGVNLGSVVTGAGPTYSYSWNSTTVANGSHTLTATASDAAGNTASSSVTVTVNNDTTPPTVSMTAPASDG